MALHVDLLYNVFFAQTMFFCVLQLPVFLHVKVKAGEARDQITALGLQVEQFLRRAPHINGETGVCFKDLKTTCTHFGKCCGIPSDPSMPTAPGTLQLKMLSQVSFGTGEVTGVFVEERLLCSN